VRDLDAVLPKLLALGAHLDGPVKHHHAFGKVAAVRAPDGVMLGLYECGAATAAEEEGDEGGASKRASERASE